MGTWQVQEAKTRLSEVIERARTEGPQTITRHGAERAVVNKRAGGQGLIVGRKAFQRPIEDGAALVHAVQDVFLDGAVTIA